VEEGTFTQTDLNEKVRKILLAKSWMGLDSIPTSIDRPIAEAVMASGFDNYEIRKMYESGLTLLQNPKGILPFKNTYQTPFRIVQVGSEELWDFQNAFSKYASFSNVNIQKDADGRSNSL